MTADELAAELEVSVRTVYRDIEALSAAGVPVYADRGRTGGYQLVDGYRTRLTGLTEEEAQSLSLAGLPVAAAELGLGTVLAAAQLKLYAALPEERYERWGQRKVDRVLDPLGLILKAGNWYLAARCDGDDRTYRVSRIEELEDLGESLERPADFDLERYWQEWSEQFERRMYPRVALVRLNEAARILLPFYLGSVGARALREAIDGGAEPDEDGWLEMELPTEPGEPAVGELLRFGGNLEVLEPPELRERLAEEIRKMGACYG